MGSVTVLSIFVIGKGVHTLILDLLDVGGGFLAVALIVLHCWEINNRDITDNDLVPLIAAIRPAQHPPVREITLEMDSEGLKLDDILRFKLLLCIKKLMYWQPVDILISNVQGGTIQVSSLTSHG